MESRIQDLKRGTDAYLAKPFNQEELFVRLAKLLEIRQALQNRYANVAGKEMDLSDDEASEQEDAFITQLKEVIEERMADPKARGYRDSWLGIFNP